jgi:hypothetical protein
MADPTIFGMNAVGAWLEFLIYHWQANKSAVITLNYDTLIERVAGDQSWKNSQAIRTGQLYPIPLTLAGQRIQSQPTYNPTESFKLYKLHGSINWFYSGQSEFFGENLYFVPCIGGINALFVNDGTKLEKLHRAALYDKVPLIIPPTLDKSVFFQHESLRSLWYQAGQAISNATRIFCIGYSLPLSDLTMAQFLKTCAPPKAIPFEIVNPDPSRKEHFSSLLGKDTYQYTQKYSGQNAVRDFVLQALAQNPEDQKYIIRKDFS